MSYVQTIKKLNTERSGRPNRNKIRFIITRYNTKSIINVYELDVCNTEDTLRVDNINYNELEDKE